MCRHFFKKKHFEIHHMKRIEKTTYTKNIKKWNNRRFSQIFQVYWLMLEPKWHSHFGNAFCKPHTNKFCLSPMPPGQVLDICYEPLARGPGWSHSWQHRWACRECCYGVLEWNEGPNLVTRRAFISPVHWPHLRKKTWNNLTILVLWKHTSKNALLLIHFLDILIASLSDYNLIRFGQSWLSDLGQCWRCGSHINCAAKFSSKLCRPSLLKPWLQIG